ncbi:nascent polypeptide-associated complex subunit alpha [Scheffersomyces xylosifermentans]|uniref:nascent polypeptide-associated complex subunit alpha n=1 Tax=Scheffersomyces xylosifermentans TaxID=1304137 RepID=UPI00315D9C7D
MSIEEIPQGADVNVIPKNEKKARELIKKLNLKPIKSVTRVTFKQRGNLIYAIDHPDVYRSAAGTYVVFGEAKVDDMNQRLAEAQALQGQSEAGHSHTHADGEEHTHSHEDKSPAAITADLEKASLADNKIEEEEEEGEVDESGLDSKDIDIIVEQTQVSRAKAVKALRAHDGDMVNAIMDLS